MGVQRVPTTLTKAQQAEVCHALLTAVQEVAKHDPRMPLGRVIALLSVAVFNEPAETEEQRLSQSELWAASGGERFGILGTFSAHIVSLSTRVFRVASGKQSPALGFISLHQSASNYREKIPLLTADGRRLVANITATLVANVTKAVSK